MSLAMEIGLGQGDFVLDGDHAPPHQKGAEPFPRPQKIGPCLLRPNGWMDEAGTWHGGLSPDDFVLNVDPAPLPKRWAEHPQIFGPCLLRPNGWMNEAGNWHGGKPQPRRLCVRLGPSPLPQKGAEPPPQFSVHFYCGQTARCIKMPLGMDVGLSPGDFVLDRDPCSLPCRTKGAEPPPNFRPISVVPKRLDASRCLSVWR